MRYKSGLFIIIITTALGYSYKVYTSWTQNTRGDLTSAKAIRGKILWQQYNCTACHQIYGLGGYMGPDLTNVIATKGKDYAEVFITKGAGKMPFLHISPSETEDLLAYLTCVGQSGDYPLVKPRTTYWGDVEINQTTLQK